MSQNYFRAGFQKHFSPGATIRGMLARYLQLHDWDPVCNTFATTATKCDWILEKRSKSHIRSSEINGFKEFKPA